eukprot:TRINITY_DN6080_c0_g2_i14.p1 TRINITY_DN6080_c0_g2~~TRINITY_DN6080_c0_g2_i14.p1  ORF type:complete len:324 (-),score=52.88 TRINITY_DN6080_c0_g2_i14:1622-2593(-)
MQDPSTPFAFVHIPFSPGEVGVWSDDPPSPHSTIASDGKKFNFYFRMRQDEAVVILGCSPPKSIGYWSVQQYLFSTYRFGFWWNVRGSLGNPVNVHTLSQEDPNQVFAIILSGSPTISEEIRGKLLIFGIDSKFLDLPKFLVYGNATTLKMGLDHYSDTFSLIWKFALSHGNLTTDLSWENWKNSPPVVILRITPKMVVPNLDFFPLEIVQGNHVWDTEVNYKKSLDILSQKVFNTLSEDGFVVHVTPFETNIITHINNAPFEMPPLSPYGNNATVTSLSPSPQPPPTPPAIFHLCFPAPPRPDRQQITPTSFNLPELVSISL